MAGSCTSAERAPMSSARWSRFRAAAKAGRGNHSGGPLTNSEPEQVPPDVQGLGEAPGADGPPWKAKEALRGTKWTDEVAQGLRESPRQGLLQLRRVGRALPKPSPPDYPETDGTVRHAEPPMPDKKHVHVVPLPDGGWASRRAPCERAVSRYPTQSDALRRAREGARNSGVEVAIHRRNGRIRDSDSYGRDPFPPGERK